MQSKQNDSHENAAVGGITPCARGESLLESLTEAVKFVRGCVGPTQVFPQGSASMFSPAIFSRVKFFEAGRNQ